jgi:predicted DNA-binding transcriptional regulator AlpA
MEKHMDARTYISSREVYSTIADKSTILRWEREGTWPRGVRLSARITVWRRSEVEAAIAARAACEDDVVEQRSLLSARLVAGRRAKRRAAQQRRREAAEGAGK